MSSKHIRGDYNMAWPSARNGGDGRGWRRDLQYREELARAMDPVAERKRLVAVYNDKFATPRGAAEPGELDDVIERGNTRPKRIVAFEMLRNNRQ